MNSFMKKISIFLLAAASILAVASCERAEIQEPVAIASGETTTLTLAFDATKTALVDGKTTWVAGDKVRIYSAEGTSYQDVEVPSDAAGKATVTVEVNMKSDKYYAVYPVESANGITDGKVGILIPTRPDGLFASANICVAEVADGTTLSFKNVTSILKVNVASNNVVEILQIKAQNTLNGTFTVGYDEYGVPVLTGVSGSRSATVAVGVDGDYYVPVAPGTYASEFAITALRGNGGYQTISSSRENEIAINTIYSLGTIGNDLKGGLPGEGTEASPYTISNDGEFNAFVASVNMGNPYEGKFVSLQTDPEEAIQTPIGHYYAADDQAAFAGFFLGNNHTIKLDLDGDNLDSQNYVALFGVLDEGGILKDIKVAGTSKATGNYTAGVVAYVRGSVDNRAMVSNCSSTAKILSTGDRVAGIAGYACYSDIENCVNNGAVEGRNSVAGIVGYGYYDTLENPVNTAAITSNATTSTGFLTVANGGASYTLSNYNNGVGGIIGWAQNTAVNTPVNSAAVTGFTKVGGIAGVAYWSNVVDATNSGAISGTGYYEYNISSQMGTSGGSCVGGIVGYQLVSGTVSNSNNSGNISGFGGVGGVTGIMTSSQSAAPTIKDCINTGNVTSDISAGVANNGGSLISVFPRGVGGMHAGTGGIIGSAISFRYEAACPKINNCTNKGTVLTKNSPNVGGILGLSFDAGNSAGPAYKYIDNCVNEGNVTGGPYRIGGILGYSFSRYVGRTVVRNCANHGTVTGTRDVNGGTVVGGIAGGVGANSASYRTSSAGHISIYNCYNDGDIVYSTDDLTDPYVGGVIGFLWGNSNCQNNYNLGYVGPASKKTPAEGALGYLGAICGNQYASYVKFSYYHESVLGGQPVGTKGEAAETTTVCSFDDKAVLSQTVTANNKSCDTLLDALNEWVNYYSSVPYYGWVAGYGGFPVLKAE